MPNSGETNLHKEEKKEDKAQERVIKAHMDGSEYADSERDDSDNVFPHQSLRKRAETRARRYIHQ